MRFNNGRKYVGCRRILVTLCVGVAAGLMFPVDAGDFLPTFKSGKFSGNFAVYKQKNFNAMIDKKGKLIVQPKVDGKPYGEKLHLLNYRFQYPEKHKYTRSASRSLRAGRGHGASSGTRTSWKNRKVVSLEKKDVIGESEPIKQPEDMVLKGETENGSRFTIIYKFRGSSILYAIGYKASSQAEKPTRMRWQIGIPSSHDIPRDVEQPEREKMLEDCLLVTEPRGDRPTTRHDYAKVLFFDENPLEKAIVRGPWGPRKITLEAKRFGSHRFWGRNRSGGDRWRCPWEGFGFRIRMRQENVKLFPQYRIKLTIE